MPLKGKRVVVVGGTSGIGLATAKAFADESAQVVIASRSASKLREAKSSSAPMSKGMSLISAARTTWTHFSVRSENWITW